MEDWEEAGCPSQWICAGVLNFEMSEVGVISKNYRQIA
jgi:hypothetical protein